MDVDEQLTSLLLSKMKEKSLPLSVSPSSYPSMAAFFDVHQKKEAPPKPIATPPPKTAPQPRVVIPPTPKAQPQPRIPTPPPAEAAPQPKPEVVVSFSEPDKKFNKFLPQTNASPSQTIRWGLLFHVPSQEKEAYTLFVDSIAAAITSKLSIPIHRFDKNEEHLSVRLQAASCTLSALLVFGEPHTQETIEKSFYSFTSYEKKTHPPFPPIVSIGMVGTMNLYFVPVSISMKEDKEMKKHLWLALQSLAKKMYDR